MIRLWVALALFLPNLSWAFPENVRHGYFSCTACHVSPSGGGVLTSYGKSLAAELMSTWGSAKHSGFMFSNVENEKLNPAWLRVNVFIRGVQTYRNTKASETAKFIPMQEDLEAGIDTERFAVVGTVGLRAKNATSTAPNEVFSRRHYLMYRLTDAINARAGKFQFAFGLNGPDHITATRRGLGWNEGSESYNLELSYLGEKSATVLSGITGSPERNEIKRDSGAAITQNFLVGEHSKLGLNLYYGNQARSRRYVYGPSWVFSFTEKLFLNSEAFAQAKKIKDTGKAQAGYATFHRLHYQVAKGLTPFVQVDRAFLDHAAPSTRVDTYGGGVQWLPYPHFELTGFYGKEKTFSQASTDFAWLMMHMYL